MTDSAPLRLCVVGLPETGKTTYIAALWAYVSAAGPPEKYHVEPDNYPADAAYLNEIADAWARGKDMPRNDSTPTPRIEFEVAAAGQRSLLFRLPDLRGEVYKQIVTRSQADLDTVDLLTGSDVLLLVVNASSATTFASLAAQELPSDPSGVPEPEPELVLDELDTDFLNTELLQKLRFLYSEGAVPPIVVLISAWDSIEDAFTPPDAASVDGGRVAEMGDGALLPEGILARVQPQLSQLVDEIARNTAVHVIGLSSTGGIKKDEPELLSQDLDKRAYTIDEAGTRTHVGEWLTWFDGFVQ